eukprot:TRINITY_DN1186_c0_g1_i1.p1 TRINITY_DN1186_c0_g1~~TRINITY_DN1186_c0_g1_i1.p1  ORF type:complete len:426 (+),score=71.93 TRINITY_DN1186_c0_g1_i1:65-1342(+)
MVQSSNNTIEIVQHSRRTTLDTELRRTSDVKTKTNNKVVVGQHGHRPSFADEQHRMMEVSVVQIHALLLRLLRCLLIIPIIPKDRRKRNDMMTENPTSHKILQVAFLSFWSYTMLERQYVFTFIRPMPFNLRMAVLMLDIFMISSMIFLSFLFRPSNLLAFKMLAKKVALLGVAYDNHLVRLRRRVTAILIFSILFGIAYGSIYLRLIYEQNIDVDLHVQIYYHQRWVDALWVFLVYVPVVIREYIWFHRKYVESFIEEISNKMNRISVHSKGTQHSGRSDLHSQTDLEEQTSDTASDASASGVSERSSSTKQIKKQSSKKNFSQSMLEAKTEVTGLLDKLRGNLQLFVMVITTLVIVAMVFTCLGLLELLEAGQIYAGAIGTIGAVLFIVFLWIIFHSIHSLRTVQKEFNNAFVDILGMEEESR